MKNKTLRLFTICLSVVMLFVSFAVPVIAAPENEVPADDAVPVALPDAAAETDGNEYSAYSARNAGEGIPYATEDIILNGSQYSSNDGCNLSTAAEYEGESNVVIWDNDDGKLSYTFNVPSTALYGISVRYKCIGVAENDIGYGLLIDGEYPFSSLDVLEFPRMWVNKTDVREDDFGNQFAPEQTSYDGFVKKCVFDVSGATVFPYEFKFTAGSHTVTFDLTYGEWVISEVALCVPDSSAPAYEEISTFYENNGYKPASGTPIVIEGENADVKSTRSLVPLSDNASTIVTPSSATRSLVNYIGFTNWKLPNEEICWTIEVPEDGLYKLGIVYKQDTIINGFAYRHLRIDDKTPFYEASNISFPYTISWKDLVFSDKDGNPYMFYLTAGTHKLSLAVTLGETSDYYEQLKGIVSRLSDLYLDIIMITSESPDKNRDYELFNAIPGFMETLSGSCEDLEDVIRQIRELTGQDTNSFIAALRNLIRVMQEMYDNKYDAQNYLSDFYSNFTTVSSWLYEMRELPVSIDQIRFAPAESDFEFVKTNFFKKLKFNVQRFTVSFSDSYSKLCIIEDKENSVKIWITWGRDQALVLSNLIQESFTPSTGISVNLELVSASIINGMLAGNAPDLTLHLSRSAPVNYAMRGALVDLSQFDDYEEVIKRFGDSATTPYKYKDGVYALPDTQSYYIMFYRTDVFEQLNLDVPNTWDEFLAATAVLQRSNMNSYLPYTKIASAGTVDAGVGALNLYGSVLMQQGGDFYNEELNACTLSTPTALSAFTYWTDMYTKYKIPTQSSFYNRFRVGVTPLGISGYTEYTTLLEAAPEIANLWKIALIPGTLQEDGTIDRTISGSGTGCSILSTSKCPDKAWEFLKWWTSAEIQTRYDMNVESILGAISRISTANLEAFSNFSWNKNDLEIMLEQRAWIEEVPEVPGSYYTSRSVDQAFWSVVNGKSSPKDALEKWGKEANHEIARKIKEYENVV